VARAPDTEARLVAVSGTLLPRLVCRWTTADASVLDAVAARSGTGATVAALWGMPRVALRVGEVGDLALASCFAEPAIHVEVEGELEPAYELAERAIAVRAATERWGVETTRLLLYRPHRLELFATLRLRRPWCESRRRFRH
jgi:hypothetical protein